MGITPERLQEFMRLYEEEFKEPIGEEEARETACRLVELYQLLAAPLLRETSSPTAPDGLEATRCEQP